jgi:hypothetical protein
MKLNLMWLAKNRVSRCVGVVRGTLIASLVIAGGAALADEPDHTEPIVVPGVRPLNPLGGIDGGGGGPYSDQLNPEKEPEPSEKERKCEAAKKEYEDNRCYPDKATSVPDRADDPRISNIDQRANFARGIIRDWTVAVFNDPTNATWFNYHPTWLAAGNSCSGATIGTSNFLFRGVEISGSGADICRAIVNVYFTDSMSGTGDFGMSAANRNITPYVKGALCGELKKKAEQSCRN